MSIPNQDLKVKKEGEVVVVAKPEQDKDLEMSYLEMMAIAAEAISQLNLNMGKIALFFARNQKTSADIAVHTSDIAHKESEKQIAALDEAKRKRENRSIWDVFVESVLPIVLTVVTGLLALAAGPAALVMFAVFEGLMLGGAFDPKSGFIGEQLEKLAGAVSDGLGIDINLCRGIITFAVAAAMSGGMGAVERAGANAAARAARGGGMLQKAVAVQSLVTLNPIYHTVIAIAKASGKSEEEAKEIAGYVAMVVTIIITLATFMKAFQAGGELAQAVDKFPKLKNMLIGVQNVAAVGTVAAGTGRGILIIQEGDLKEQYAEIVKEIEELMGLMRVNETLYNLFKQTSESLMGSFAADFDMDLAAPMADAAASLRGEG